MSVCAPFDMPEIIGRIIRDIICIFLIFDMRFLVSRLRAGYFSVGNGSEAEVGSRRRFGDIIRGDISGISARSGGSGSESERFGVGSGYGCHSADNGGRSGSEAEKTFEFSFNIAIHFIDPFP